MTKPSNRTGSFFTASIAISFLSLL